MAFGMSSIFGGGQYNGQARANEAQDQQAVGQFGGQSATEGATLNPFFSQEMRAKHSLDPNQQNELLTNAEAGSGGAFGGAEGVMNADAARTGNATTLTKSLDEMARDKAKVAAGASEGIAGQDIMGAKALNQEGAKGLEGLYGTNVSGQLGAMKQADEGIKTEQATQAPSFMSDLTQLAKGGMDVANLASGPGKTSWLT